MTYKRILRILLKTVISLNILVYGFVLICHLYKMYHKPQEFINIDEECLSNSYVLYDKLALIPEWLIESYKEEGGTIFVTTKSLSDIKTLKSYNQEHTSGMFVPGNLIWTQKIYLSGDKNDIKKATCHEFGHYLDKYYDWISQDETFFNIFSEELPVFLQEINPSSYYTDPSEYFAEAFNVFCLEPDLLLINCPKTYSLIHLLTNYE